MARHARTMSPPAISGAKPATILAGIACCTLLSLAGCDHSVKEETVQLPAGDRQTIELSDRVVELNNIRTAVASLPSSSRTLQLPGQLALDVNRLVHIHARFPGQIVQLAMVEEPKDTAPPGFRMKRTLNFMDRVHKGQKLGEIWSKDLGEKKSELVDALVQLSIDQKNLKYLQDLLRRGATTEKSVREAERQVEVRQIAVAKAERTLRSWSLPDEDIREVRDEAERIHTGGERENLQDEKWATVDVISPIDGTVVEKNVVEGDLVPADADLFKIADLSVLTAWVRVYEEDLPYIHGMPKPISWTLRLNANPQAGPITGTIDRIGEIIDPNDHMALLAGPVYNTNDQFHAGQFITAEIDLPREPDVIEVPARAVVEDGDENIVFVQTDSQAHRYTMRRVVVVRRNFDFVYLRSRLTPEQQQAGLEVVREGELVVAAGALELKAALQAQHGQ